MTGGKAAGRRARKRANREARRREEEERERRYLAEYGWRFAGLEDVPTQEIAATLATLGVQTDQARFRELAQEHGDLDGIAQAWRANSTAIDPWNDYLWLAARALWPRWAPDLFSMDVFVDQHLPAEAFYGGDPQTSEEGHEHWQRAQAVMDLVAPPGAPPRPDLMEDLGEYTEDAIADWLVNLPYALAELGMVDEAAEVAARMSPVCDTEFFLAARAVVLAEAGRKEEAIRQLEANLAQLPEDFWVRLKAGDAYKALGDFATAEAMYRRAIAMSEEADRLADRGEAVWCLVDALRRAGRQDEADTLEETEREALDAWLNPEEAPDDEDWPASPPPGTVQYPTPKVGRNDACPCGSGKKYKRCCGA